MRALLTLALILSPLAASALDLQTWSSLEDGVGVYSDSPASKVSLAPADAGQGQKAVHVTLDLVKWGGVWAGVGQEAVDLSKSSGIQFRAKASAPLVLVLGLKDAKKVGVEAAVRVVAGDWQDFQLPLSAFKKPEWQDPEAPKNGAFDASKVAGLNLSPRRTGKSDFSVGPLSSLSGKFTPRTGLMQDSAGAGKALAQDFEDLEVGGYGTYADDKGTKLEMSTVAEGANRVGLLSYDLKEGGWCGAWMRVGDGWGGMDWRAAKSLSVRVKSARPEEMTVAFNDLNQVAYIADLPKTQGKGWETLSVPMSAFKVNEYYQPPQAKKGAALDLSHIESLNIGLRTPGKGSVEVDDVTLGN